MVVTLCAFWGSVLHPLICPLQQESTEGEGVGELFQSRGTSGSWCPVLGRVWSLWFGSKAAHELEGKVSVELGMSGLEGKGECGAGDGSAGWLLWVLAALRVKELADVEPISSSIVDGGGCFSLHAQFGCKFCRLEFCPQACYTTEICLCRQSTVLPSNLHNNL